ncbi:AI-2E family transporter [Amycolatopsis sp. BJA-103]|uniref:AI-2E family transporter n=1 Tax=Amycolatopsis sp. BJA-103 TaxID=1911175 RepID=UPI000C7692A6|nr:AI-2E family transporter [Amycolatopsis sp. BJA-103]AUI62081.1 AI-2E family transporter [Amycolatopsis sp. BJA-103]PNE20619.1 AI-2E family transporter [Amycolatopsis sp. BJA-103]
MADPRHEPEVPDDARPVVPRLLRVAAELGWRLLVVGATLYLLGLALGYLSSVVVPVSIALLLAAMLAPAVTFLVRHRIPRGLAVVIVLIGGLAVLGGLLTFVVLTFVNGLPALRVQLTKSVDAVANWLTTGPLHLSAAQLRDSVNELVTTLTNSQTGFTAGALTTAATVGGVLAQALLVLFVLIFLLADGPGIWTFLLRAVPAGTRTRADVAGRRSLAALVSYVRATIAVATVDAVGIGIGMAVLGVPLAIPLSALVFLGAFVPIIGSVVVGTVAVLIALVSNGLVPALILLGVVLVVQQLESHLLQPILLGRAVRLHPLAVVLAIATGLLVGGIAGALLAVPLLAVLNSAIRSLRSEADEHVDPADVHASRPAESGPPEPGLDREPELRQGDPP